MKYMAKNDKQSSLNETDLYQDTVWLLGENATAIIHELRAPLSGIYAHLQLMQKNLERQGYCQEADRFALLYEEVSKISDLCNNIMGLASGKIGELRLVDISEICYDTVALLKAAAVSEQIQLELNIEQNAPYVLADETQIRRVLVNLITNAIQALTNTTDNGLIQLTLYTKENNIWVIIKDNGPGIAACDLPHVFDRHFTTKAHGTGLGLPMCKDIAEMHNGALLVKSGDGLGASFILRLPIIA